MGLIAVPNVSEGRDPGLLGKLVEVVRGTTAVVADVHSDTIHNRSVLTVSGAPEVLTAAMSQLAGVAQEIDLTRQEGVHPRLGGLDVCPIVPHGSSLDDAVAVALRVGKEIAERWELPVYLYGAAAKRPETRELPDIRRGGLSELRKRALGDLPPDLGPHEIDPTRGVVCVGARDVLIAFNVWIEAPVEVASEIAAEVRERDTGVRALGFALGPTTSQVSMNLTQPAKAGIDTAFEQVKRAADERNVRVAATELIGVPPQRFMPDPKREATRLLKKPGRSLEIALTVS